MVHAACLVVIASSVSGCRKYIGSQSGHAYSPGLPALFVPATTINVLLFCDLMLP
jgi:hypothetical protein